MPRSSKAGIIGNEKTGVVGEVLMISQHGPNQ
jgi:hypothetical protein